MYNTIQRDSAYIERLSKFIQQEYSLLPQSITPAKRGYFGETWMLDTLDKSYFLKLDYTTLHQKIYAGSFPVIQRLCDNGIDFISKILKTADGALYSIFDSAVLGVFDWIDGENVEDERTKIPEYEMLARVYAVPAVELDLQHEDFSTKALNLFFEQLERLKRDETATEALDLLHRYSKKITYRAARLRMFSNRCANDISGFVITHGDAGGNVIMNGDKFHIIDWDAPILAPPERDAWFCQQWDWAMEAFQSALRKNGVDYILRPERLAYYCYHSFFWYLTEHLQTYFDFGNQGGHLLTRLSDYLNCWIEKSFEAADRIV